MATDPRYGKAYRKQLREWHIANGECTVCGRELSDPTFKTCANCRQLEKTHKDKKRADGAIMNKCSVCGIRSPRPNRMMCQLCTNRATATQRRRRDRLRAAGLCDKCGQEPAIPFVEPAIRRGFIDRNGIWTTCHTCYLKKHSSTIFKTNRYWKDLLAIFDAQDGKCLYTGETLVFGLNASIDHKYPISRFPELEADLDNLEWVTDRINTMKRDMTKDEFLAIIRQCQRIHRVT